MKSSTDGGVKNGGGETLKESSKEGGETENKDASVLVKKKTVEESNSGDGGVKKDKNKTVEQTSDDGASKSAKKKTVVVKKLSTTKQPAPKKPAAQSSKQLRASLEGDKDGENGDNKKRKTASTLAARPRATRTVIAKWVA